MVSYAKGNEKHGFAWKYVRRAFVASSFFAFSVHAVFLLPKVVENLQPSAEFIVHTLAPSLWTSICNWSTPLFIYIVLNIVLVTMGVKSMSSQNETLIQPTHTHEFTITNFHYQTPSTNNVVMLHDVISYTDDVVQVNEDVKVVQVNEEEDENIHPSVLQEDSRATTRMESIMQEEIKFKETSTSMYPSQNKMVHKKSRMCRSPSMLSKLGVSDSEPYNSPCPKNPASGVVVFEISSVPEEIYVVEEPMLEDDFVTANKPVYTRHEIGRDELYDKAESFIKDFHKQLKIQREDSWNRLLGRTKRSYC